MGWATELAASKPAAHSCVLVLNCPAAGISGFQREPALAGRVEVVGVFCLLHSSEDQAVVILPTVPGKGCCGKFGPGSVLWMGEPRGGEKKESTSWILPTVGCVAVGESLVACSGGCPWLVLCLGAESVAWAGRDVPGNFLAFGLEWVRESQCKVTISSSQPKCEFHYNFFYGISF